MNGGEKQTRRQHTNGDWSKRELERLPTSTLSHFIFLQTDIEMQQVVVSMFLAAGFSYVNLENQLSYTIKLEF